MSDRIGGEGLLMMEFLREIYEEPTNLFVAQFIGEINILMLASPSY